jgi:hypothetical protein
VWCIFDNTASGAAVADAWLWPSSSKTTKTTKKTKKSKKADGTKDKTETTKTDTK